MASAAAASEGHGRLVRCLMRSLLRDARRVRHSRAPFLFLQERPRKETYSHLWEVQPGTHDRQVLDKLLPSYLRHELSTCELTGQELERIVKSSFRRFRHLGVPGAAADGASAAAPGSSSKGSGKGGSGSGSPGRRRGGNGDKGGSGSAGPMPTLDQAVDDLLALVRLMAEQLRLFECTSVTETHKVRVIATAIPAATEATAAAPPPPSSSLAPPPQQQLGGGGGAPAESHYFMYQIRVENRSRATVQLVGREWVIQDSDGRVTDSVPKGSVGVVGHEPILRPGAAIAYMSGARLPSAYGSMHGSFQMVRRSGGGGREVPEAFDAVIEPFLLK